jgi:hypothetical protein
LHGDGRRALPLAAADEVRVRCAQHAERVNTGVLVKAFVLGGQDGLGHDGRHILDAGEIAPLFAKLANQVAVAGIDAERNFWLVVGQYFDRRQLGVGKDEDDPGKRQARE